MPVHSLGPRGFGQELGADTFGQGVSRLISFGIEPARVGDGLIEPLRMQEASVQIEPERFFKPGERVRLTEAPFTVIEGNYQWPMVSVGSWC